MTRRLTAAAVVSALAVAACAVFVVAQLQPRWLLSATTPAGGDMGAHVWGPAYVRDHLLPNGRITGWTPDWYAGFPAYTFYFPLPSLLIVLLDVVLPYGIAFKLVTVLGVTTMPISAWFLGRMLRLPFPTPPLMAIATLPFLFDRFHTIWGGNVASTLAGEFSFSISLSLVLVYLGVLHRGLETGRWRALSAVLLAACGLCHLIPTMFALAGTAVILLMRFGVKRIGYVVASGAAAGAIAGFWLLPFAARLPYTNDMGWERTTTYLENLLPFLRTDAAAAPVTTQHFVWASLLAAVGAVALVATRRRGGVALVLLTAITAAAFRFFPDGALWNARFLPFWYLCCYLLAAAGVGEAVRAVVLAGRSGSDPKRVVIAGGALVGAVAIRFLSADLFGFEGPPLALSLLFPALLVVAFVLAAIEIASWIAAGPTNPDAHPLAVGVPVVGLALVAFVVGMPLRGLPFGRVEASAGTETYQWLGFESSDQSFIPGWASWNYSGYEQKDAFPEYRDLRDTMASLGASRGCGRAMWEYESELDRFGTPMALMLLPYWTDGCIGSMEGLFFESSSTTPYHFLSQSELSLRPSRAQRDLPYRELDLQAGVRHMQLLGARYYLALTPEAQDQAQAHPDLTKVAESGPWQVTSYADGPKDRTWHVYEVAGAELVQPLESQPVVVRDLGEGREEWLEGGVDRFQRDDPFDALLVADGPRAWPRADRVDGARRGPSVRTAIATNIEETDDRISFDVDRVGTPVLVKASYFPNWKASGADGPWRVTPNLMVVVPTSNRVELHYGWTPVDLVGIALSVLGLLSLVALRRWGKTPFPQPPTVIWAPPYDQDEDDLDDDAAAAVLRDPAAGDPDDLTEEEWDARWARPPDEPAVVEAAVEPELADADEMPETGLPPRAREPLETPEPVQVPEPAPEPQPASDTEPQPQPQPASDPEEWPSAVISSRSADPGDGPLRRL